MTTEDVDSQVVDLDDELEVSVVDDTPPADAGRKSLPPAVAAKLEAPDEDDLDGDVEEVRRKAKEKLSIAKKAWHDERREKEQAQRIADEATKLAQGYHARAAQQQTQLATGETYLIAQMQEKVKQEVTIAKAAYKAAYESADADALTEAQEKLSRATNNALQVEQWRPTQQTALQEVPPVIQRQSQAVQPTFDEKAQAWASKNNWYGADDEMTKFALRVHAKLVNDGVDPKSEAYYATIDRSVHERFPEAFSAVSTEPGNRHATVVASVQRSAKGGKKVTLTQTQVSLARRLGLTNEQYARELIKTREQANG